MNQIIRPGRHKIPVQQSRQTLIAAGLCKLDIVDRTDPVEGQKLLIDRRHVITQHPGDIRHDGRIAKILHHRHTLVALLHIEAAKIFSDLNGIVNAIFRLHLIHIHPFAGEFSTFCHNRHIIVRK